MYVVRFIDNIERTFEDFDYMGIIDALQVVKNFEIDGVVMSDEEFESKLTTLLTRRLIHRGKDNRYTIMLWKKHKTEGH